jgi:hypothetical protein
MLFNPIGRGWGRQAGPPTREGLADRGADRAAEQALRGGPAPRVGRSPFFRDSGEEARRWAARSLRNASQRWTKPAFERGPFFMKFAMPIRMSSVAQQAPNISDSNRNPS